MEREEYLAELRRQWTLVPEIHLPPSSHHLSEEAEKEMGEFFAECDREQQADQLLLRSDCAFASLDEVEGVDSAFAPMSDDDHSEELREETYANLCLRCIFADAMDVAIELLGALKVIAPDETEPSADVNTQRSVGTRVACWLVRQGYEARAWAFVERPLFNNNGAADIASAMIADLSFLHGTENLLRARSILKREELHWLKHPEFGHLLQLNAIHMWLRLWETSKQPEDLESARSILKKLHPSHLPKGFSILAKATWEVADLLLAMEIITMIPDQRMRADEAGRMIEGIALQVFHTKGSQAFEAVARQVADGLQNERWKSLLLEKLEEALKPFRTN